MTDIETISQMFTRFFDIINSLKALDREIPNVELVNEILFAFQKPEQKVTIILQTKDLTTLKLSNSSDL